MLLLSEEEAGQVWGPSKHKCCLGNVGTLDMKILSLSVVSVGLKALELPLAYKNRRRTASHAALCHVLHVALRFEHCTFHLHRGRSRSLEVCRTF
jgi:hypothetical protein